MPEPDPKLEQMLAEAPSDGSGIEVGLLHDRLRARLLGESVQPRTLGRFEVARRVGAGGMGTVYAGFDPQLKREVALKVLRARGEIKNQLVREAKAMARLEHPNIVSIFDVGTDGSQVYIAMQLIDGQTLSAWLTSRPDQRQIVSAFVAAARGLAAAHDGGVVHGDFKPANVVRARDGAIMVIDFGLSRVMGHGDDGPPTDPAMDPAMDPAPHGSDEEPSLRGGTLGYLAPELLDGESPTHATDQFALCVSMFEGLCGERPFSGHTPQELGASIRRGVTWPSAVDVPKTVVQAVTRGLSVDPKQRFASVRAFIEAITVRRRGWLGLAGLGAAAVLVVGGAALATAGDAAASCDRAADPVATTWTSSAREQIDRTLADSSTSYAAGVRTRLLPVLDRYAAELSEAYHTTCAAPDPKWAAQLDERKVCLDERTRALAALVSQWSEDVPKDRLIRGALRSAHGLSRVSACADPEYLAAQVKPPESEAVRAATVTMRDQRREIHAALRRGDLDTARRLADENLATAEATPHRPEKVYALNVQGVVAHRAGDLEASLEVFEAAYFGAREEQMDVLSLQIASNLVALYNDRGDFDASLEWFRHGQAVIDRAPDEIIASKLHHNASVTFQQLDRNDEAEDLLRRSLDARERILGREHPTTANALFELGNVLMARGELDDARTIFVEVRGIFESVFGPDHPDIAGVHNNLGNVLANQGDPAAARDSWLRALSIRERAFGPEHMSLGGTLTNLGDISVELGDAEAAKGYAERALTIRTKVFGPDHPALASVHELLGDIAFGTGDVASAYPHYNRAVEIHTGAFERLPPPASSALVSAAVTAMTLENLAAARKHAERLLQMAEVTEISEAFVAQAQWVLARALWDLGVEHDRALALAETSARAHVQLDGPAEDQAAIATWLAEHSAGRSPR